MGSTLLWQFKNMWQIGNVCWHYRIIQSSSSSPSSPTPSKHHRQQYQHTINHHRQHHQHQVVNIILYNDR